MELHEIQKTLKAPKSQFNSFGKYKYRNCEDILEAVKPLLEESTLVISDEVVQVGERYYVKATARFTCGEKVTEAYGWAREPLDRKGMDDSQITGATSSYARKYALNGLFCIDDNKDADNDPPKGKKPEAKPEQKPQAQNPAGPPAYTKLRDLIVEIGVKAGESKAANALIEYCTSHLPGGKITLAFAQKFPGVAEEAIKCIQDARANFSDTELLAKAQEKMRKP